MSKHRQVHGLHMKDVSGLKPKGFEKHLTIGELARLVDREISWMTKLERADRIPKAARVRIGQLSIRLWSPRQVKEIQVIMGNMRPGRPRKS